MYITILMSLLNFRGKFQNTQRKRYRIPIREVQEGVHLGQNLKLDTCGSRERRAWGSEISTFFVNLINEWPLIRFFFAVEYSFFVSLSLFTLCSFIFVFFLFFFSLFCMLSKELSYNFKKRQGETNLKKNLKMHHTQVSFIWIIEAQNKWCMTKKSCRVCWI